MADWDWAPPVPPADAELFDPLALDAAPGDVAGWPDWLGGVDPVGPVDLALDELPVEAEAPPEAPAAPAEDPLAALHSPPARLPWDRADDLEAQLAGELEADPTIADPAAAYDAITGGGAPEPVADPTVHPLIPQPADPSYDPDEAEQVRISTLSNEQLAREEFAAAAAWRKREAELLGEALEDDKRRQRENDKLADDTRREAREELAAIKTEAAELAQSSVDPGRWFADATTTQKIGAGIAAVFGGFMAPHQGGRNTGLEFIMKLIDQDIAAQLENLRGRRDALNQRRGLVSDLVDLGMDEHRAAEVARRASLQTVEQDIALEQAKFEEGGTTWLRGEALGRKVRAAEYKLDVDAEERSFQRKLAIKKDDRADRELRERQASTWRADQRAKNQLAWEREKYGLDKKASAAAAEQTAAVAQREDVEKRGIGGLVQADGRPFLVGSTEERSKLATKLGKVQSANAIINRLLRARESHGWTPGLFNSEEFQEARSDWGALNFGAKDIEELGVIAGADLDLIENFLGASGPGVRDPSAGLRRARDNWNKGINDQLRARNYTGPDWSPALTLHDKQERTEYLDQMAREKYGATQGELAAEYEKNVADSAAAGVAPESIADFKTRKEREHKEFEQSLRDQASRAREAARSDFSPKPGQRY